VAGGRAPGRAVGRRGRVVSEAVHRAAPDAVRPRVGYPGRIRLSPVRRSGVGTEVPHVPARPRVDAGGGAGRAVQPGGGLAAADPGTAAGDERAGPAGVRGPHDRGEAAARHRGQDGSPRGSGAAGGPGGHAGDAGGRPLFATRAAAPAAEGADRAVLGDGLLASVDGVRFVVPVRTINAAPSPKYLGSSAASSGSTPSTTRSRASGRWSCRGPRATPCTSWTPC
jgi:hypothetical protein